ncbi:DUF397 domain-containing protein [Streptomyces phaeochromogenes]|uniref:DUF397 domain-containing protein n=1 Tax=Streptomyces phaeochromogenes TaxID=1923 RepID=UPI00225964FE|nr:DUF397 domain-containing protein [Streptomyces phaeochromogenes]MCX5600672.1 DUF397 domain-containing protein [Streptomyces phaeochromogenes]
MRTTELAWFKSSYSGSDGDDCVEVAASPAAIHVRDSKNSRGPQLDLSPTAWGDFVASVSGPRNTA